MASPSDLMAIQADLRAIRSTLNDIAWAIGDRIRARTQERPQTSPGASCGSEEPPSQATKERPATSTLPRVEEDVLARRCLATMPPLSLGGQACQCSLLEGHDGRHKATAEVSWE